MIEVVQLLGSKRGHRKPMGKSSIVMLVLSTIALGLALVAQDAYQQEKDRMTKEMARVDARLSVLAIKLNALSDSLEDLTARLQHKRR